MRHFIIITSISFTILLAGCDLFSTRSPEKPTGRNNFEPPTSADIVISNFKNAINRKNADNFLSCLSDTSQGGYTFTFTASSEALSRFTGVFVYWDRLSEFRTFNSIISALNTEQSPNLSLFGDGFNVIQSDSAVYYANYDLSVPHSLQSIPTEFTGTLQFTLKPNSSQLWSIVHWVDISTGDSAKPSWSILKGTFAN